MTDHEQAERIAREMAQHFSPELELVFTKTVPGRPSLICFEDPTDSRRGFQMKAYRERDEVRLKIFGLWPILKGDVSGNLYRMTANTSITIAASKSPERIAKDVKRRFLPHYYEVWKEVNDYRIAILLAARDKAEMMNTLADVFKVPYTNRRQPNVATGTHGKFSFSSFTYPNADGKVTVSGYHGQKEPLTSIMLYNLPPELAHKLAKLIAQEMVQ